MIKHRIHYIVPGGIRCGRNYWHNSTHIPSGVTCESCKKLMKGQAE